MGIFGKGGEKWLRIAVIAVGARGEEARRQIDVSPQDTVGDLYRMVAEVLGKELNDFTLTYKEKPLDNKDQKIATLGMKDGDTVYATIVADGGLGLLTQVKSFLSSIFSNSSSFNFTGKSRESPSNPSHQKWLNIQYAGMQKHQPAARAIDLKHYYCEYRASDGPFKGEVFRLHMFVKSPYDPPLIFCENPHGHPNFGRSGRLCIRTPWQPFGSLWEYLDRVKSVIRNPNYDSPAR